MGVKKKKKKKKKNSKKKFKIFFFFFFSTAGSEDGVSLLLKQGCTKAFNHRKEGYVQEIISNGGCDVILEMLANVNLNSDLQILKKFGRVGNKKIFIFFFFFFFFLFIFFFFYFFFF